MLHKNLETVSDLIQRNEIVKISKNRSKIIEILAKSLMKTALEKV